MKTDSVNRLLAQALAEVMTLQEIGDLLGLTRERVRQLTPGRERDFRGRKACPVGAHLRRRVYEVLGGPDGLTTTQQTKLAGSMCGFSDRPTKQSNWHVARSWILAAAWLDGASHRDIAALLKTSKNYVSVHLKWLRRYGYPFPRRAPGGKTWLEGPLAGQPVGRRRL